jgi:hypothetical protein
MPKQLTEEYFDSLARIIARFPDGALIREIKDALPSPLPQRTLQDHLSRLVKQRRIVSTGKGVASRYHAPSPQLAETNDSKDLDRGLKLLPLSDESIKVKDKVSAEFNIRTPVGYNRAFLDDYRPNETFYLSSDVRKLLYDTGTISEDEQPAGTYVLKIYNRLLIDLSWNSSRLEGNTYSLLETERLLELGESAEGKDAEEAQMILNHKAAIDMLCEQASNIGFNRYTICNLHAVLSDNLLPDPQAYGRIRTRGVGITGTVFHPLETPQTIEECFDIILQKASSIEDPFEQAFFVMVQLPYLQPFEDVNKRLSRLATNIPLVRMNLCPLSFVDVPEEAYIKGTLGVYELNAIEYLRDVFVWAYKRSCARYSAVRQSLGKPDLFRLKHQEIVKSIVYDIVHGLKSKTCAVALIKHSIPETLSSNDRNKLIEVVETELSSLHEGNIARYRLKPSEHEEWRKTWQ